MTCAAIKAILKGTRPQDYFVKVLVDYDKPNRKFSIPSWLQKYDLTEPIYLYIDTFYPEDRSNLMSLSDSPSLVTYNKYVPNAYEILDIVHKDIIVKTHPELLV